MIFKQPLDTCLMLLLTIFFLLFPVTFSLAEGKVGVGAGFDYSSGDYGGSGETNTFFVPVNVKYQSDDFSVKVTLPYIRMESEDSNVVGGGSSTVILDTDNGGNTGTNTESGMGDVILKGTYYLFGGVEGNVFVPSVDLSGKLKIPTADDDKGLGTGEADYSFESDFTWFTNQIAIFTTVGYKFMGSNETYDLNDVAYASLGFSYQLKPGVSVGLLHDVKEATTNSGSAMNEATGFLNYKFSDNWKCLVYAVKGFSDGSADYGIGATLSFAIDADEIDRLAPIKYISDL